MMTFNITLLCHTDTLPDIKLLPRQLLLLQKIHNTDRQTNALSFVDGLYNAYNVLT